MKVRPRGRPVNVGCGPPVRLASDPPCPDCGGGDTFYYWDDDTPPTLVCVDCTRFYTLDEDDRTAMEF